ncbi:hypothetical protein FACS189460_3620 [Deltaproteobacteria bacterium]|nr:hypothetical protein FACS189460_3620 [Deltaproteobacteria bacterium]
MAKDTSGEYFIIARAITGAGAPSAVARDASADLSAQAPTYLIHNPIAQPPLQKLTAAELAARWAGQAILLTPRRSPFAALRQKFNLKWFISATWWPCPWPDSRPGKPGSRWPECGNWTACVTSSPPPP